MTTYTIKYLQNNFSKINTLEKLCYCLVEKIHKLKIIDLNLVQINGQYKNINYIVYKIKYDKTDLILYNSADYIRISSISPDLALFTTNTFEEKKTNLVPIKKSNFLSEMIDKNPRSIHQNDEKIKKSNFLTKSKEENKIEQMAGFHKNNEENKIEQMEEFNENDDENQIKNTTSEELLLFKNNKRIYYDIKKDILENKLAENALHDSFIIEYQIFKIMETKNCFNGNIESEFSEYQKLKDICDDETPPVEVFVPHNYHFMTLDEKQKHVDKYNLTIHEFEKSYVHNQKQNLF